MNRHVKRALLAIAAVAIGVASANALYGLSVQPGAALVKQVFDANPLVVPPANFSEIESRVVEKRGIKISAVAAPASSLNVYAPRQEASLLPVVLWVHGGGFVSSSADTVKDYAITLADQGFVVASLDYSLAPDVTYPAPVRQGDAALRYLRSHAAELGGDAGRMFVAGDSAGAQIASQLAAVETNPTLASRMGIAPAVESGQLRGVVLFCGLYDMRTVAGTGFPALRTYLWSYTGVRDWVAYSRIDELSTTTTATTDYPATFVSVGDADPFRSQASELISDLRRRGVSVNTLLWGGTGDHLGHEYQFKFDSPEARTAFTETVAFLHRRSVLDE